MQSVALPAAPCTMLQHVEHPKLARPAAPVNGYKGYDWPFAGGGF